MRRLYGNLLLAAALLSTLVFAQVLAAADEEAPWLLIEVTRVLRGPASDELEARRARIVEQLETARTPAAKRRTERALADLEKRMARSRSFVLDGWSSPASNQIREIKSGTPTFFRQPRHQLCAAQVTD